MTTPAPGSLPESIFHGHTDIGNAHLLRNPLINAELRPISLLFTSPNARITDFGHNPNLHDPYFAKIYLPYVSLTGYREGVVQTAEGRAYLCVHFNRDDPRVFGLASLHAPEFGEHEPSHGAPGPPAQPHSQPANIQVCTQLSSLPITQPVPQHPASTSTTSGTTPSHASAFHATLATPVVEPPPRPSKPPLPNVGSPVGSPTPALFPALDATFIYQY